MATAGLGSIAAPPAQGTAASAVVLDAGPAWTALTAAQREVLAPLAADWPTIEAPRKAKWLEVASRMQRLPASEQARIQQRMAEWARLTPVERARARQAFLDAKDVSAETKAAQWEAYRALPAGERKAFEDKARRAAERPSPPSAAAASTPALRALGTANAAAASSAPKAISPSLIQGKPGATTSLMTTKPQPPLHQSASGPRLNLTGAVDPVTLLPLDSARPGSAANKR